MPECGPEEESFMAPGVLLAHHSECLNQPQVIPGAVACLALSAMYRSAFLQSFPSLASAPALLTSPQTCCPPL